MNKLQILRTRIDQDRGRKFQIEESIEELQERVKLTGRSLRKHERAREIIREVGLKTQEQLQVHISDITSLALDAVFEDPYELVAEFVQRRNKTECDLMFERDGERMDPIGASGGGAVDVAAFALRIAAWSMQSPKRRNVVILDEPMKFLDGRTDRIEKASQIIKELSDRLGIQFIIITHENTLAEHADKTFTVKISKKGVSQVK